MAFSTVGGFIVDQHSPTNMLDRLKMQSEKRVPPGPVLAALGKKLIGEPNPFEKNAMSAVWQSPELMAIHIIKGVTDVFGEGEVSWIRAQFNPTEISRAVKVKYAELAPIGSTSQAMHYIGTENQSFKFDLFFDAYFYVKHQTKDPRSKGGAEKDFGEGGAGAKAGDVLSYGTKLIRTAHNFLESICYPSEDKNHSTTGAAPPECLFYWPNFISLTARVESIDFKMTKFAKDGSPLQFTASVQLKEVKDVRTQSKLTGTAMRGATSGWSTQRSAAPSKT